MTSFEIATLIFQIIGIGVSGTLAWLLVKNDRRRDSRDFQIKNDEILYRQHYSLLVVFVHGGWNEPEFAKAFITVCKKWKRYDIARQVYLDLYAEFPLKLEFPGSFFMLISNEIPEFDQPIQPEP